MVSDGARQAVVDRVRADRKRVKRLQLTPDVLVMNLTAGKHGIEVVENPLPDDVAVCGRVYDPDRELWDVLIWSGSFEQVPEGDPVPLVPVPVLRSFVP